MRLKLIILINNTKGGKNHKRTLKAQDVTWLMKQLKANEIQNATDGNS